jgi:hypothetical protein
MIRTKKREQRGGCAPQIEKFRQAAHELGCDEDESAFDEMVKKVAKAPPPRQPEKTEKPKRKAKAK